MLRKITFLVAALHLAGVIFLIVSPDKKAHRQTKHLTVKTHRMATPALKTPPGKKTASTSPPAHAMTKKNPPPSKIQTKPAPIQPKSSVKKSIAQDPQSKPAKKQAPKKDDVWIEPALTQKKPARLFDLPSPVAPLQIDSLQDNFLGGSYQEALMGYLHDTLRLPDYGEVKIEIILNPDGSVQRLTVLKSESAKNKTYLEKTIPSLNFPSADVLDSSKKEQRYILTFCNEI